jgi:LPXTG-motif cell wall-anchored protein
LPQTGQLNWPIPAMAIAGAVLLVLGWILLAGRKRAGHAE